MPSFRLDLEPWIPVEMLDGSFKEVSLVQVFEQAANIRRIGGNPVEVAVLHRLLLAIAHQVRNPRNQDEWLEIWNGLGKFLEEMASYVQSRPGCFDLYDAERPFGQNPKLHQGDKPVAVLLYDRAQGNNPVFLDASQERERYAISSGAAARALLTNLAFGGSHPDKSNPLSTGQEKTMYAGPLCARLIAVVEAERLDKTLALNLAVGAPAGKPSWERPIAAGPKKTHSEGLSDRYTRLTRFIRLTPSEDGRACISVALHMGEQIAEDEDRPNDPMIPLYLANDKKFKVQRLDPGKALWRSSPVLLNCRENSNAIPIRALEQLNPLVQTGEISRDEPAGLRIVGVAGSAQGPKTEMWRDETLPFSLSVVSDDSTFAMLVAAVDRADNTARSLRARLNSFADRFIKATNPTAKKEDATKLADELAPELIDFWSEIGPLGERLALGGIESESWSDRLNAAANAAFEKAVNRLPPSARRFKAQSSVWSSPSGEPQTKRGKKAS